MIKNLAKKEVVSRPHPSLRSYWLLEGETFFFESVATGRFPRLQWMDHTTVHMASPDWMQ